MLFPIGVLFFGLLPFSQLTVDTSDQCTVVEGKDFHTSINADILSYITPDSPLYISLSFQNRDYFYHRDNLETNNHHTTHYKTRKNAHSNITYTLPLVIPEGWNRLKVRAMDKKVTLQWTNGNDEVSLLALTLDFLLAKVFLRGNFSVCSGDSPEWDVKEGNVTIQLQPLQSNQLLEVTGNGSLVVDHKTSPESRKEFANTTLRIKTWRKDSHSIININEKDEGDQGTNMTNEIPRPHLTVRSEGGVTHLRLYLSDGVNCGNESNILQGFNIVVTCIAIVSGIVLMCTCVFNIAVHFSAKMTERQTGQNRKEDDQNLGFSLSRLLG